MAPRFFLKQNFSGGEISPVSELLYDSERVQNSCITLENMISLVQGPAVRRNGFQFIYSLNDLDLDTADPKFFIIPFVYDEDLAYVYIFYTHDDGAGDTDPRVVFGTYDSNGDPGLVESGGVPVYCSLPGYDIEDLCWAQSGDDLIVCQSGKEPTIIRRISATSWNLVTPTWTNRPTDWSAGNGWPEVVTFFQQRLVFAANTAFPNKVWASMASDFYNFTTGAADDDPVIFTINSGDQNKIKWMNSKDSLIIGTMGDEWTVTGATNDIITPTSLVAKRQSNKGGAKMRPENINFATLFVQRHARKINEFVFDYKFNQFEALTLNMLAPHITQTQTITDWTYQQEPNNIIWLTLSDGTLPAVTYHREAGIIAWHRHETTGEFLTVASIPRYLNIEDGLWVVVKREVDGDDVWYVETKAPEFEYIGEDAEDGRFLDSYKVYDSTATTTITGADHLEGETVRVLADGAVHPDCTVASGTITLNYEAEHVVYGLGYTSKLAPHIMDPQDDSGAVRGRQQHIKRIYVDIYRSLGFYYGYTDKMGVDQSSYSPTRSGLDATGQALPLETAVIEAQLHEGEDNKLNFFIEQDDPLPLMVRGVTYEVQAGK